MKAFTYRRYGSPEVLQMEAVQIPLPHDQEVLIQVQALSLNPAEWHQLRASIGLIRLQKGWFAPNNPILGADLAGEVIAVGSRVQGFQKGDRVFGRSFGGALAELSCMHEDQLSKIPEGISYETAAALPLAAATALQALRDIGTLKPHEHVLINGASGGIGTFAVQLAGYFQSTATGVCSGKNVALVRRLGAHEVIDYTQEELYQPAKSYDLVIDLVGNLDIAMLKQLLSPTGRSVSVGFSSAAKLSRYLLQGIWLSKTSSQCFKIMNTRMQASDLRFLGELVAQGKLSAVIDSRYAFTALPAAFERVGSRRAVGKVVVKME